MTIEKDYKMTSTLQLRTRIQNLIYEDITCKGALSMTGRIKDIAKDKKQKLVFVNHDLFDHRTTPRNEMRKKFNEFMYTVMKAEPLDKSLLDFDDSESWN